MNRNCEGEKQHRSRLSLVSVPAHSWILIPHLAKVAKETEGTCRVSGLVVKKADGAPLKNALVQLENNEDRDHTIVARTTADGHFELRNLLSARPVGAQL